MSDEPYQITERGDPRDRISNQREATPVTTPADHAATVREGMENCTDDCEHAVALAALVSLAERATELDRQFDTANEFLRARTADVEALRQRATELERERDGLAEALREFGGKPGGLLRIITAKDKAEARAEQLETALRQIANWGMDTMVRGDEDSNDPIKRIARAALDGGTATPEGDDG